jgi:hypothetical protein
VDAVRTLRIPTRISDLALDAILATSSHRVMHGYEVAFQLEDASQLDGAADRMRAALDLFASASPVRYHAFRRDVRRLAVMPMAAGGRFQRNEQDSICIINREWNG